MVCVNDILYAELNILIDFVDFFSTLCVFKCGTGAHA